MASLKPDFGLQANSKEVTDKLYNRVTSIEVILDAGCRADQCILQLDDRDNQIALPQRGEKLKVALGYQEQLASMGEFEVAEFSHYGTRDQIEIVANSALWSSGFKGPKQQSWPSDPQIPFTLGQLLDKIAKTHGFEAKISESAAKIVLPHIDQNQSDMQLLQSLANVYDLVVRPVDNKLLVMEKGSGLSRSGAKLPVVQLNRQDLMQWQFLVQRRALYNSCKAWYHDLVLAKRESVTAGSDEPCYELHKTYSDKDTASLAANARLSALKRSQRNLELLMRGRNDIYPGQHIQISGVRADIDNRWSVAKVRHLFDKHGFVSRLYCEQVL